MESIGTGPVGVAGPFGLAEPSDVAGPVGVAGPFGLVVRFVLRPGAGEAFDALMRDTVAGIRADEPDTLLYVVHRVQGEPDVRVFYELYRTEAALADHERQPTTRYFLDRRDDYIASYTVDRLNPLTDKGIDALDQ